ncbi:MAG: DUF1080 domain-containing protein [Acidobacteria bacterium]|nr:DUF1080 domain-containing protein [Acidobacteriota bacterium]
MRRREWLLSSAGLLAQGEMPLFDGRTLAGWHVNDGPASAFYVDDGAIVVSDSGNSPTWLRSERVYENFEFQCEFFVRGWIDSAIYLHAPRHGDPQNTGFAIKLFHKNEAPKPEGMGSIFPLVAPLRVNVKSKGEWNDLRVVFDWPRLRVWTNGELVQDFDVNSQPETAHRLRQGYIGIQSLGYPIRFRNLRVKELPSKLQWKTLYSGPADLNAHWQVEEGKARWMTLGPVLRADGLGHLETKELYKDFVLELYYRASKHSNGGVMFRADGSGAKAHYEIQLHDVEGAVYPTGSLYGLRRARYRPMTPEQWYPMQVIVHGKRCLIRINGETMVDYDALDRLDAGHVLLQAHQTGKWVEYKDIRIRAL